MGKSFLLKDIFGLNDTEIEKVIENATDWVVDIVNDIIKEKKPTSYFSDKKYVYTDGELTKKYEKEYVNGKCIKNDEFDSTKVIDDNNKQTCACNCNENNSCCKTKSHDKKKQDCITTKDVKERALNKIKAQDKIIATLQESNKKLKGQINEMTTYIDGLNDKIKKCEMEKAELKAIVDNIKKCF